MQLPEVCKHGAGTPDWCSQCRGAIAKKVVALDEGGFAIDGQVVRTAMVFAKGNYGTLHLAPGTVNRCLYCRKAGHTREECKERIANESLAASRYEGPTVYPKAFAYGDGRVSKKGHG